jgi:hypothetical protein
MERQPYNLSELFIGNEKLFQEVLQNPKTIFVYDIDGIISNSPKIVLKNFREKNGINVSAAEIDGWNYLTNVAKKSGLDEETVKNAEKDWYDADVLLKSQRYLYIKPVIQMTMRHYGPERNFVLTSRNFTLDDSTFNWFKREAPEIRLENILIRKKGDTRSAEVFKVENLKYLAERAPHVVFVDDSIDFVKAVLDDGIKNCLVINIPQGKIMPDFAHERLIIIKRFPDKLQAMYPFFDAVRRAIG